MRYGAIWQILALVAERGTGTAIVTLANASNT
jgi:hypothetical protein